MPTKFDSLEKFTIKYKQTNKQKKTKLYIYSSALCVLLERRMGIRAETWIAESVTGFAMVQCEIHTGQINQFCCSHSWMQ
jgi:hypothetical protein